MARAGFATGSPCSWAVLCGLTVAAGAVYALLGQVAFWLLNPPGSAAFYPAGGLAFGVLALAPRRSWPRWIAAFVAAEVTVHVAHHRPFAADAGYAVADMVEPIVGALLFAAAVRRFRGIRAGLISFALLPVAFAPVLGAAIGATSKVLLAPAVPAHDTWWYYASHWWIADALGVLVIGSVILAWARPAGFGERATLPAVAAVAAAGAAAIVASGVLWHYPLIYIALPALVWGAVVGGARAVTIVAAAAAMAADWVAITGRADRMLASPRPGEQLEFLQLFIGVLLLTGLVLTVEVAERHRSEQAEFEAKRQLATIEEVAVKLAEAERRRITQDVHDIVGHSLNAILLQIGAARRLLRDDPARVTEMLSAAENIGRRAFGDLDTALLATGTEPIRPPGQGLERFPELISVLRDAGVPVDLRLEGERGELSTLLDWSAYRILQEAVSNVLAHAPGAHITIVVRFGEDAIHLAVTDDGGPNQLDRPYKDGRGIIGMRERAAALGGTLNVGQNARGGFTLAATLPRRL